MRTSFRADMASSINSVAAVITWVANRASVDSSDSMLSCIKLSPKSASRKAISLRKQFVLLAFYFI